MSSFNTFQKGKGSGITHFFAAFKLDLFGAPQEVKEHIGEILQDIRKGEKAEGQNRIYTHGEKEAESRAKSIKEGVYIDEPTWNLLETLKKEFAI
jgi:LDH2 family malate/lactate/ureidoglycolate dehydrogenase